MQHMNTAYAEVALQHWQEHRLLEAGRVICENIPSERHVRWAANILQRIIDRTAITSPPIARILQIASSPAEWKEAHDAFSEARRSSLHLADTRPQSPQQALLVRELHVAELVAKVIYNAANPPDPFDHDSAWWIVPTLKDVLEAVEDDSFSQAMWSALCCK